ncbi:hypothetical protein [Sphingobium yanoikuyae]|uniref:hypothetical protein n=1 Tax=Sphingobium yanoikuyae TaxID=13690 RepID=UPI001F185E24|nr:hypothetical protein [Sphingobium yanoikuyae]
MIQAAGEMLEQHDGRSRFLTETTEGEIRATDFNVTRGRGLMIIHYDSPLPHQLERRRSQGDTYDGVGWVVGLWSTVDRTALSAGGKA